MAETNAIQNSAKYLTEMKMISIESIVDFPKKIVLQFHSVFRFINRSVGRPALSVITIYIMVRALFIACRY